MRGLRCSWPVRGTTLLAVLADLTLFQADTYGGYLLGQLLLGLQRVFTGQQSGTSRCR